MRWIFLPGTVPVEAQGEHLGTSVHSLCGWCEHTRSAPPFALPHAGWVKRLHEHIFTQWLRERGMGAEVVMAATAGWGHQA